MVSELRPQNNAVLEFVFPFVFASCSQGGGGLPAPPLSKLLASLWELLWFVHGERAGRAAWWPAGPRHRGGFRVAVLVAAFVILAVGAASRGRSQLALCEDGAERARVQVTPRSAEAASRAPSLPGLLSYCPVS